MRAWQVHSIWIGLLLLGCASRPAPQPHSAQPGETLAPPPPATAAPAPSSDPASVRAEDVPPMPPADGGASLRARVEALWTARKNEDWKVVFSFEYPAVQSSSTPEAFADWAAKNDPFKIHEWALLNVQVEQSWGWAEIRNTTSVRKYPTIEPRSATKVEKWRWLDGNWYPVSSREMPNFPEPVGQRDASAEQLVAERFRQTWEARLASNWNAVYELSDPRDHDMVPRDEFAEREGEFQFLDQELVWIEVLKGTDAARVRVNYLVRMNDDSLTKLDPKWVPDLEIWVFTDGQWYRELVPERRKEQANQPSSRPAGFPLGKTAP